MILVNSQEVKITKFPNRESLVDTSFMTYVYESASDVKVTLRYKTDEDLVHVLFVIGHIKEVTKANIELVLDYMPYSRMDRSQNNSCFTLKHTVTLLTSFLGDDDSVSVVEPHSQVTIDLFRNERIFTRAVSVIPALCEHILLDNTEVDTICFPDKGARDRYGSSNYFKNLGLNIMYCEKVRDFDTGTILGLALKDVPDNLSSVLILDDLCSKGTTFLKTAEALRQQLPISKVYLGVCHLEENIINGSLIQQDSPIDKIYATSSMPDTDNVLAEFKRYGQCLEIIDLNDISTY
jgi:ribose-phosphate pyrophosphokinase